MSDDSVREPGSGLLSEAFFRATVTQRIAVARRVLRPLTVALLTAEDGPVGVDANPDEARAVATCLLATVRDSDTVCRLDDGRYALILEDTSEDGAVWGVQRVRQALGEEFPGHVTWAGLACYPAHAFGDDEIMAEAEHAPTSARDWPQDRIEVAPLKP